MAWPVFSGIICYFSFCSDLHTNTHIYAHTHQHIVEGWSQWQSSLQDNRWTKGTRRGECQARMEAGWVEVGAKGNSWRGLMGDEKVVVVVAGGGVSLTLASVRWSDGMQRPPAVREEDEEQGRIKALTPLALFKLEWLMTKHTDAQNTPADPCEPAATTAALGLWCGHFPNTSDWWAILFPPQIMVIMLKEMRPTILQLLCITLWSHRTSGTSAFDIA